MHKDKIRQFVCDQVIEMEYNMSLIMDTTRYPYIAVKHNGILEFKYQ